MDVKKISDEILQNQPHRVCPKCKHLWVPAAFYCGYDGEKLGPPIYPIEKIPESAMKGEEDGE